MSASYAWHKLTEGDHERGASLVEYALLVLFIAIAALLAVTAGGNELSETYSEISSGLVNAGS